MSHLSDYIRNLAVFLVFASFIGIISPGKKYKAYIDLVLGIILIFVLTAPLAGVINALAGGSGDIFADMSLAYDRAALSRQIAYADDAQQSAILQIYKDGLAEQTRRLIENHGEFEFLVADFAIDVAENFGAILGMELVVQGRDAATRFLRVDPVRIEPVIGGRGQPAAQNQNDVECPHILSLKNLLASFYNLDKQRIHIKIAQ